MKQKFLITGMTCASCSAHVEKSVRKLEGVDTVQVNLLSNSMEVEFDNGRVSEQQIIRAVENGGYGASLPGTEEGKSKGKPKSVRDRTAEELKEMKTRLIVSFAFLVPLMYISMHHMLGYPLPQIFHGTHNAMTYAFTQFLLCLPIVYVNRKYYQVGFKSLFRGAPNMDSLIAIGSTAAMVYGIVAIYRIGYGLGHGQTAIVEQYTMDLYFESAAMILALITLGKYLETRSKGKTGEAIAKLVDLAPKKALVEREGQEVEIPAEEVVPGDVVLVKPGSSIPVDGVVLEGVGAVDQSALTGESIPVEKREGDTVAAATINQSGFFKFRATKVGEDTALAQIIRLVEEAGNSKAPIAKLADKISGVFVPVVIAIAVIAAAVWLFVGQSAEFALSIGISVLVISCPCALGLATPVAIMVGTGKGAENGILIKSAEALETAHGIQTVVLDKTGTVTEGKPRVTNVIALQKGKEHRLLEVAAALEKSSEHPLAQAIMEYTENNGIIPQNAGNFSSIAGRGVTAEIEGSLCLAGNAALMKEHHVDVSLLAERSDRLADEGKTPLYFAEQGNLLGCIAVADVAKATSKEAIALLESMGIEVVMLTGDNHKTAEAIRRQLGLQRVVAEVLPQDKEAEIRAIQKTGKKVAMVGDGINDAPALARADVGVAIGAGTDVAIESADIVLMKNDLLDVATAIQLSKAVIKNIKMNLFWAFFYNSVGIPLAAGVFFTVLGWKLNPMFGAAAMSLSSVCVVTNALRLKFFKPKRRPVLASDGPAARVEPVDNEQEKGEDSMKKVIGVEGMHCGHCQASVEKALKAVPGVDGAKVDLQKKTATVSLAAEVTDEALAQAVIEAGFEVTGISIKKGVFGN